MEYPIIIGTMGKKKKKARKGARMCCTGWSKKALERR